MDPIKNLLKLEVDGLYNAAATTIKIKDYEKLIAGEYNLTWWNETDYPDPAEDPNVEIIRVVGVDGDEIEILRGQEDTVASTKNEAGKTYRMVLGITKKTMDEKADNPHDNEQHNDLSFSELEFFVQPEPGTPEEGRVKMYLKQVGTHTRETSLCIKTEDEEIILATKLWQE